MTPTHSTYMTRLTYYQYTNTYNFNQTESTAPNTPTTQTDNPPTHTQTKKTNHIQQHKLHQQHRHTPRHSHTTTYFSKVNTNTHLLQRNHNKLIHQHAPKISHSELSLPRETRRTLAQLRTNISPIQISYLHTVDETHHTSTLCKTHPHTTDHIYPSNNILDLWMSSERVVPLLVRYKRRLAGLL